ncbi:uncharacterized protein [Dermacentor albipictus]|uniref:uncharacterized protein isoform X1 n=1 Tax=Dermacentor albipictus TaxID=60249 RepID=UPI0031FD352D
MSTTALQGRRMFAVAALIALTVVSPAVLANVIRADNKLHPPSSQNEEFAAFNATRASQQWAGSAFSFGGGGGGPRRPSYVVAVHRGISQCEPQQVQRREPDVITCKFRLSRRSALRRVQAFLRRGFPVPRDASPDLAWARRLVASWRKRGVAKLGERTETSLLNYNYYYNNGNMTECRLPSPCGWFMYHPVERNFLHYLQVCYCPTGMRCLADRDDVSISCWVYKCKVAPPGTPANPPVEPPM